MLNEGADSKALTIGGQSAIHIACRTRQSNTVGLLTELCTSEGQSKMIDLLDEEGRTALHYACRPGRTESVKILLGVGADPYVTDHKGKAPLDACAELPDEDYRWCLETTECARTRFMDVAYVTLSDQHRPKAKDFSHDLSELSESVISLDYFSHTVLTSLPTFLEAKAFHITPTGMCQRMIISMLQ